MVILESSFLSDKADPLSLVEKSPVQFSRSVWVTKEGVCVCETKRRVVCVCGRSGMCNKKESGVCNKRRVEGVVYVTKREVVCG